MIHFNKNLAPNKGPLIVMCSGGIDSIVCAHFLSRSNPDIWLYHFHHNLRPQNDDMRDAVLNFAADMDLGHIWNTADKELRSEAECRDARFADLTQTLKKYKDQWGWGDRVVCCHHLDDCVESYLMNCFNGHSDWAPIPAKSAWDGFSVYRPFLLTEKKDLISWAEKFDLMKYVVEDETNEDFNIRRNFVRHELRPLIETRWDGLSKVVKKKIQKEYDKC